MPYHVRLHTTNPPRVEVKFDLSREYLEERIVEPYRNLRPIVLGGRTIRMEDLDRIEIVETPRPSAEFKSPGMVKELARQGTVDWAHGQPGAKDVSDEFITTPAFAVLPQKGDAIELMCSRFHAISSQLRQRHAGRETLDVTDEYDVQDLMHALLHLFFDDIRPEEWTPSYAGKASRMDFLLPAEQVVVETKKTRQGLGTKEVGDELIVDIERYKKHPDCKRLICFVYDPEARVANPRGIEKDLSRNEGDLEVKVIIAPKV